MKLIEVSEDILASIKIPRMELEKVLRIDLAISLYHREAISLGNARKLACMSKWEFLEELGRRKVPRHYTEKEIGEDLTFAKNSL